MSQHTPGPWTRGNGYGCGKGYAICAGSQILARINGFGYPLGIGWDSESEANANLMVVAPELFVLLKRFVEATYGRTDLIPLCDFEHANRIIATIEES